MLGFVGWLMRDEPKSQDDWTSDDANGVDAEGAPDSADGGPGLEGTGDAKTIAGDASLGKLMSGANVPVRGFDEMFAELVRRHRLGPRPSALAEPHVLTRDLVHAHRAGWRAHEALMLRMLVTRRDYAEGQVLISALEALQPLSKAAMDAIREHRFSRRRFLRPEFDRRFLDIVSSSMGMKDFVRWAVEDLRRGVWHAARGARDRLRALAAEDAFAASLLRETVLAYGDRGLFFSPATVIGDLLPNDPLAELLPFEGTRTKPGSLGTRRDAYVDALHHESVGIRVGALEALHADGTIDRMVLRQPLLECCLSPSPQPRKRALKLLPFVLSSLEEFVPTLDDMLRSEHEGFAAAGIDALLRMAPLRGDTDVVGLIARAMARASDPQRVLIARSLSQFRLSVEEETRVLAGFLDDRTVGIRLAAVELLGEIAQRNDDAEDARLLIERAQRDGDPKVSAAAAAWVTELRMAREEAEEEAANADDGRKATLGGTDGG